MKPRRHLLLASLVSFSMAQAVQAAGYWWNSTSGSWGSGTNWSDAASGGTTGTVPTAADSATFNQSTVNDATAVTLDGNRAITGLTFANTGATTLTAGSAASTLTLGRGGITLASGTGAVTFGDGTAANDVLLSRAADQQAWTNNSASDFTLNNSAASPPPATGTTLIFTTPGTGLFKAPTTALPNSNGITGPWALYFTDSLDPAAANTAAGYTYAFNNAGTIAAFTGAIISSWTAASGSLPNSVTTNYDITGGLGDRGFNITANTLRVVSADPSSITFQTGSSNGAILDTNGLLNAGAGLLTIGLNDSQNSIRVGANLELVLAAMAGDIAVTGRIINSGASATASSGGTASNMTIMGGEGRTVTLSGSYSTVITGTTTVNSGTLLMNRGGGATAVSAGGLTVNPGGTVQYGASAGTNQISDSGNVVINRGTLDLTTKSDTIVGLTLKSGSILGTTGVLSPTGGIAVESGEISGILGGASALTKSTTGTVTLSGANTFNGTTTVTAGLLVLSNELALQRSAYDTSSSLTGGLDITGLSSLTLGGLIGSADLSSAITGSADLGSLTLNPQSGSTSYSGTISNGNASVVLTKSGAGTQALAGNNTYSGGTIISNGTLALESAGAVGTTGTISMNGGRLQFSANNTTDYSARLLLEDGKTAIFNTNGQNVTFANTLGLGANATAAFTKTGAGSLTIPVANNYTGATGVNGGTLVISNAGALGTSDGGTNIPGETFDGTLVLDGGNPGITITGEALSLGARQLTIIDVPHVSNLTGNNTWTGDVTFTLGGADYNLESQAGRLTFSGQISAGALTSNRNLKLMGAGDGEISGAIINGTSTATVRITKLGDGTWTLNGANLYTGPTTVTGGTLVLGSTGTIDASATLAIAAGAKFDTTAKTSYTLPAAVTIGINGTLGTNGLIDATGKDLVISNATVNFDETGTLTAPVYVLANYATITGTPTSTFSSVETVPGYNLVYDYNGGTQIALVQAGYTKWADVNAPGQSIDQDHDNDGVDNGIEYFMGLSGTSFTANPALDASNKITWTMGDSYTGTYGTDYLVQTSSDLNTWDPVPEASVTINNTAPGKSLAYTLTGAGKRFVRLKVIK